MTKRMLSLLLALVMTLSLCVPALAADEFAAEAVTEVEEQAPAAPAEKDAPAAAAVAEEVDEPDAVYSVEVTDDVKKALDDAITAAAKDVTAVKNHEKMTTATVAGVEAILGGTDDTFLTTYEEALDVQKKIAAVADDITDKDVKDLLTKLENAQSALKDKADNQEITISTAVGTLTESGYAKTTFTIDNYDWFYEGTNLDDLKMVRRADYVEKLMAAVAAAEDYNAAVDAAEDNKVPVKDLWAAVESIHNVKVDSDAEKAAKVPTKDEADALKKLYDEVKAKTEDTDTYASGKFTYLQGSGSDGSANNTEVSKALEDAQKVLNANVSNGFNAGTTYWGYNKVMTNLTRASKAVTEKAQLVSFGSFAVGTDRQTVTVYLVKEDSKTQSDSNKYVVTSQVGSGDEKVVGSEVDASSAFSSGEAAVSGYNHGKALTKNDVITFRLYLYNENTSRPDKSKVIDTLTVSGYDPTYNGPLFRGEAKVGDDGNITGKLTMNPTSDYQATSAKVVLVVDDETEYEQNVSDATYTIPFTAYKGLEKAGKYTLELRVTKDGKEFTRSEITVDIPALSEWKAGDAAIKEPRKCTVEAVSGLTVAGMDDLDTFLTAVGKISENLVLKVTAPKTETVESVKALLANAVAAAKTLTDEAKTLADSQSNRDKVTATGGVVDNIKKILAYVEEGADLTELNKALAEAKALKEEDYTPDSWIYAGIENVIKTVEKALKDNSYTDDQQAQVDALTKQLTDAMEVLEPVGADKAALNAAIAAAKALKEEDYTEDSWKAAELASAITAAQAVADKANASVTEINAAIAALNAAEAKLVKKEKPSETHPAPASGTGWSYDATTGEFYFYKNNELVSNYWVGKVDGASQWDGNWYYVGSDGKLFTGMTYIDDLHGGFGWYFLQPTNANGEIGKMLTGWQWVGGEYGTCYFSAKSGEAGKCTYSTEKGNWTGTAWEK